MTEKFEEIAPQFVTDNVFKLIGADWMLITAGTLKSLNTMTASWGGLGVIWGKAICWCVIRPHRFTYKFMEEADVFTLSFFEEQYRGALNFCGTKSGKDVDKVKETGLTPVKAESGAISFSQARLVFECRKIYYQDIDPSHFLAAEIAENYPNKDYHRMYFGEIVRCLARRSSFEQE